MYNEVKEERGQREREKERRKSGGIGKHEEKGGIRDRESGHDTIGEKGVSRIDPWVVSNEVRVESVFGLIKSNHHFSTVYDSVRHIFIHHLAPSSSRHVSMAHQFARGFVKKAPFFHIG